MKVLMVGATGRYAKFLVPELKRRGVTIRALVRNEATAALAREGGVDETALGDLHDADSLRKATHGVDGVFHINPAFAPNEAEMGIAMVEAAKANGVLKFVLSGVIHPSLSKLTNHVAKLAVEEAIYESGMDFTVLQPTMFMRTIELGWKQVLEHSQFGTPYSKHRRASYVDYRDVAQVAALALTGDKLAYGTFELSAPKMVNRVELTGMMSDALGRDIEATEPTFDEWARMARVPDGPVREGLEKMYADYDRYGFPGGNALVLEAALGHQPRTLKQFIEELANR